MSHNISHIFYINLAYRKDRREEIERELNSFGLEYERFEGIHTPGCGSIGCSYSHLGVLKLARERGYKNVLILEDDFQFTVSKSEFEEGLTALFANTIQFDVCMLGYNLKNGTVLPSYPWLTRVYEAQTTSAYLVNNSMYDTLINLYEWSSPLMDSTREHWNYACDQSWKKYQPETNWYCFTRRMGIQRPSYSDNTDNYEDYQC